MPYILGSEGEVYQQEFRCLNCNATTIEETALYREEYRVTAIKGGQSTYNEDQVYHYCEDGNIGAMQVFRLIRASKESIESADKTYPNLKAIGAIEG